MLIIKTLLNLYSCIRKFHKKNKNISLVPTMGNLHDGHVKLINEAKLRSDIVVVTIFVNPMQFCNMDELIRYPRTLEKDYKKLSKCSVDLVFSPSSSEIFPNGTKASTYVKVSGIPTVNLGGINLSKHFRGVSTIISKFFNLVKPNIAFFGEKDYQQLMVIRKMTSDMGYNIEIVGIPTVRCNDGLALSSRNNYLTIDQRKIAPFLNKKINAIKKEIEDSKRSNNFEKILLSSKKELEKIGFKNINIQIRDANTLLKLSKKSIRAVILATASLGLTRLIDNQIIDLINKKPC